MRFLCVVCTRQILCCLSVHAVSGEFLVHFTVYACVCVCVWGGVLCPCLCVCVSACVSPDSLMNCSSVFSFDRLDCVSKCFLHYGQNFLKTFFVPNGQNCLIDMFVTWQRGLSNRHSSYLTDWSVHRDIFYFTDLTVCLDVSCLAYWIVYTDVSHPNYWNCLFKCFLLHKLDCLTGMFLTWHTVIVYRDVSFIIIIVIIVIIIVIIIIII